MKNSLTLNEMLSQFQGANGSEENLVEQFNGLAECLLYGGYLTVNDKVKIYIRDIEFYYHEEKGLIKDPIMYHREENIKSDKLDYFSNDFPFGYLNAHQSGIDICFENEDKKYRASVLIRGFNHFKSIDKVDLTRKYDNRPTYLYSALLMGVPLNQGIHIKWVDTPSTMNEQNKYITDCRVNVCEYDGDENKIVYVGEGLCTKNKKYIQDKREWRYIRQIK